MLDLVQIQNFRKIDRLELKELNKINVFLGGYGSVKTSILEAIYILTMGGNPEAILHLNSQRGFDNNAANLRYLFTDKDITKKIVIENNEGKVTISNKKPSGSMKVSKNISKDETGSLYIPDENPFNGIEVNYLDDYIKRQYLLDLDGGLEQKVSKGVNTSEAPSYETITNSLHRSSSYLYVNKEI